MSEINGHHIIYYILNKSDAKKRIIAVTKETKTYSEDPKKLNKNVKLQKDIVSEFIDEYDFTKTLSLD